MKLWNAFKRANKLSQILKIALTDMKLAEKRDDVSITMWNWINVDAGYCMVCLAGSILLRRTEEGDPYRRFWLDMKPEDQEAKKLYAIDVLRKGDLASACAAIGSKRSPDFFPIPCYYADRSAWHERMQELLTFLEDEDL